jgi:starch synthase
VLTEVVSDPERARAYGEAGRKRATEEFSWQRIADQTAALYAEVTAAGR